MNVLCFDNCHVWRGANALCDCEMQRVAMYGLPHHYNPFGPHAPAPAAAPPDVTLVMFHAAQAVNATHLTADGLTAYDQRQYSVYQCFWDDEEKCFGSWFRCDELPADAVVIDG